MFFFLLSVTIHPYVHDTKFEQVKNRSSYYIHQTNFFVKISSRKKLYGNHKNQEEKNEKTIHTFTNEMNEI